MVNAVCFNPGVFKPDVLASIVERMGARMGGCLGDESPVNCLQSFADGSLFYAFCWPREIDREKVIDTGGDIEKFIHVNTYGRHHERTD